MMQVSPQLCSDAALEIRDLAKCFDRPAVSGLALRVRAGEFYTLLGPNGAGKTTTLRMATGLLKPDRGSISVFGIDVLADPVAAKQIMAWLSDEPMIYDRLTPLEYLYFVAGLWGVDSDTAEARARDLVGWLGLSAYAQERCEGLSKGTRQKVALAGAKRGLRGRLGEPVPDGLSAEFGGDVDLAAEDGGNRVVREDVHDRLGEEARDR